jgi:mismatch-specific thymine-DNA glycosylase
MDTLPNYLGSNLKIIFVGTNPGRISTCRGHYFAKTGNPFWKLLFETGLLTSEKDVELPSYGYGLTDIVKKTSGSIRGFF